MLTPVEPPTRVRTTSISVEQNFHRVRLADNLLRLPVIVRVRHSVKESKSCAIFISDCDGVMLWFTVKVSETDPDGVALRNLDFLDNVEVAQISFWEVETGQDTTCCQLSFPGW